MRHREGHHDADQRSFGGHPREHALLASHGVRAMDTVAIQSENRPQWGLAYLAILEAGAIAVPLDAQLQDGDTGEILAASEAKLVVASRTQQPGCAANAGQSALNRPVSHS